MGIRPILFNTEMVKAIMENRKMHTRRLVKGLPLAEPWFTVYDGKPMMCDENGEWYPAERFSTVQPGDILWVRETWNYGYIESSDAEGSHESWFEELRKPATGYLGALSRYFYLADKADEQIMDEIGGKWRPSIHMPKEAARLFLWVVRVRCERLQDMTPEDCANDGGFDLEAIKTVGIAPLFGTLWDSTVKKKYLQRCGWKANPWVWVYEFERVEKPHAWG